jgi:thiamine-phosphate pyrophosphorylase
LNLVVISSPKEIENETEKIIGLFESGLDVLHIRKPDWVFEKFEGLLKSIPPNYYKRIVVHSHYKVIEKYNLRGIHLTGKYLSVIEKEVLKELFRTAMKRNLTLSTSMHSIKEIQENKLKYNYIFLSPLFDSISKEGYTATMNKEEIKNFLANYNSFPKILALGGIDKSKVEEVKGLGFSGIAVLGALWNHEGKTVEQFRELREKVLL